jgi:tRNA 2-thiouridine synthesizing protein A
MILVARMFGDGNAALTTSNMDTIDLDLRGLKCPLPAMKVARALAAATKGARVIVRATDPMSVIDIPHAVATAGATLIGQTRDGRVIHFEIER